MANPLASLRSRVFAATALVAVLPTALALGFATRRVTQQAEAELSRELEEAVRLVEQYHRTRLEMAAEQTSLVADLPKLKAAVAEADARTAEPVARDYRERVRSDVLVLADRSGRTLVSLGADPDSWTAGPATYREEHGRLLETLGAPIYLDRGGDAPELLGHLTLGFALDDAFAARLRALTGSHVAVAMGGRVYASTLPRDRDSALLGMAAGAGIVRVALGGEEHVAARAALGPGDESPFVVVARPRAEALRPLRTLRTALYASALAAVGLGLLLSWGLARTVTRPLAALTATMKEMAATGDLARGLGPGRAWDDEDARLVARTFGALTGSIARFQREATLRERLSALGRLSTVIAHEVRNPLMIIKGSLRTLKGERPSAEAVREAAADIDHQVARLDRIVGDVLDFARPLKVEPAPVDVAALAAAAPRAAFDGSDGPGPRLVLDPSPGTIVTDGERLRGVLVNLLENARDGVLAAGRSGPEAVEIGARRVGGGRVLLWVEDRGPGVSA
ncbi:MAG TPA: histidine kinase dimerization/phospho-acceptor domain-containing protein, partial [Vicinamibacteria bacterium]|nr:histidine kinase dimerization/phospho-acceptor domain-containing protein [Vicinamibacteria bacterium]